MIQLEMANGFGNRFLWFHVKSNKVLSRPAPIPDKVFDKLLPRVKELYELGTMALATDSDVPVKLDADAEITWDAIYRRLREDQPDLAGAMIARGSTLVLRMALIYALVDQWTKTNAKVSIRKVHLEAALAVWDYCEESAHQLFHGSGLASDNLADKLIELLANGPMSKSDLNTHLNAEDKKACIAVLNTLVKSGHVSVGTTKAEGAGRPSTVWQLT